MIKLIDILREAKQAGILYHSTSGENLISILKSNSLNIKQSANYTVGTSSQISFTRDKNYRPGDYTIELDGNKLSNIYKIDSYAYGGNRGEAEEIINKDIKDIKSYITNIYANVETVQERPIQELERIMRLYPSLKFTIGGDMGREYNTSSGNVMELPKAEALTYIKYNKY